jgi:hypothetical protein
MSDIPDLVRRYFELAPQPDADAYVAQFAPDATVEDENKLHHGIDAIRAWRREVPLVTYTLHDITNTAGDVEDGYDASVDIAGGFAPDPIRLTFHFEFDNTAHIRILTIRP